MSSIVITDEQARYNPATSYKAVVKFSELTTNGDNPQSLGLDDYVAYLVPNKGTFFNSMPKIKEIDVDFSMGNMNVNVMGVVQSSMARLVIWDEEGTLIPDNENSEYYGYLVDGLKVEVYIATTFDTSEDPDSDAYFVWGHIGDYYTTNISGGITDGYFSPVELSCEDLLNIIGQRTLDISEDEAAFISGLSASDTLAAIFEYCGIPSNKYVINISSEYDNMIFGVKAASHIRDIFNDICQATQSCIYTVASAMIYVEGITYTRDFIEYHLNGQGALSSSTSNASRYNSVVVNYNIYKDIKYTKLASDIINVPSGTSHAFITLNDAEAIAGVNAHFNISGSDDESNEDAFEVRVIGWKAWRDGIYVFLQNTSNSTTANDVFIDVYGKKLPDGANVRKSNEYIINESVKTIVSSKYEFNAMNILENKAEANTIAENIRDIIRAIEYKKEMLNTMYGPTMGVGEKVVIYGCTAAYNGSYKISKVSWHVGETYSLSMELLKL